MYTTHSHRPRDGRLSSSGVARAATLLVLLAAAAALATAPDASAQEAAERRYSVEEGDTLWGIAERLLDDPLGWRRIWEANRGRLEGPDRLRPGQELVIPGTAADAGGGARAGGRTPEDTTEEEAGAAPAPVPPPRADLFDAGRPPGRMAGGAVKAEERPALRVVTAGEALGAPFLARRAELGPRGRILGPVRGGRRAARAWQGRSGDRVRVRLDGLQAGMGDTLLAVTIGPSVDGRGRVVRPSGLLRVRALRADTAVAGVERVFGLVQRGNRVVRTDLPPAPDGTEFRPADREIEAEVLRRADGSTLLRFGGHLFLGRGANHGVRPGDVFVTGQGDDGVSMVVVRVRAGTSTARVVDVGDATVSAGVTARLARRLVGPGR